jgi:UDP-N-acetylglucosamine/UDP-N-acetylgalactosamine diphosphorylase
MSESAPVAVVQLLARFGQDHLVRFWPRLNSGERIQLIADIEQVDFARCAELIEPLVRRRPALEHLGSIAPVRAYPPRPTADLQPAYADAQQRGEAILAEGRACAFTVAGGQGTRLGYDGPKGAFRISPVRNACLFQLFAEQLRGTGRRYGRTPHWYVMTSPSNDAATRQIFEQARWYGLPRESVTFFPQAQMPAFLPDGRIAMEARHRIVLSPDGHGGSLAALRRSGALDAMKSAGVEFISYFQVDNPLVRALDPLFLGLHAHGDSEMSSKAVAKADDLERVGNFCVVDGKIAVIEYSDLPEALAHERNADGSRRYDAGSIAIHILSRTFVERLTAPGSSVTLPWHRADKKVDVIDDHGELVRATGPNVVKLETFVFDAIPLARNPLVLMTERGEEFSPVKNADGADSPATSRRDQVARAACWLEQCGVAVPRAADGSPDCVLEISSELALDAEDLRSQLGGTPEIARGARVVLQCS